MIKIFAKFLYPVIKKAQVIPNEGRLEFGLSSGNCLSDLGTVGAAALTNVGIGYSTISHHITYVYLNGSGGPYGALRASFGLTQTEFQLAGQMTPFELYG